MRYAAIVKRESGFVAGWFYTLPEAETFAEECNRDIPTDPARAEKLEGDEAWDVLLGIA